MAKETVGLKLDTELAAKFKGLQGQYKSAQEFTESLLSSYTQAKTDRDMSSPISNERAEIERLLAKIGRMCSSTLELSVERQLTIKEDAEKAIEEAQTEVVGLKASAEKQKEVTLSNLEKLDEQNKIIENLRGAAESTAILKEVWDIEKSGLTDQISSLNSEAQEAKKLKKQVVDLEKELSEKTTKIALVEQKNKSNQAIIEDLKILLAESKKDAKADIQSLKEELFQVRKSLNATSDALNTEKVSVAKNVGKLTVITQSLDKEIYDRKKFQEKSLKLENEVKITLTDNRGLKTDIENLKAELEKTSEKK